MKKIFSILLIIFCLIVTLNGCVQDDLIDVQLFSTRFNKYSDTYSIDKDTLIATDDKNYTTFRIKLDDDHLLSLMAKKTDYRICNCSLTFENKDKKFTESEHEKYYNTLVYIICSYVNLTKNEAEDILKSLNLNAISTMKSSDFIKCTTPFYVYSFSANEFGCTFDITSTRLEKQTEPDLTLKK